MARQCSVCIHPEREAIDQMIVAGTSLREITGRFPLSKSAVDRHKTEHVPSHLAKAQEAAEVAHADTLLGQVKASRERLDTLQRAAEGILGRAVRENDLRVALDAIRTATTVAREMRGYLDLLGELEGELDRRAQVNVIVNNPQWVTIRTTIIDALQDYPEARTAVVRALGRVDTSAAA